MKLYHGSDQVISTPKYNAGNPNNDYGLGFYLTGDEEVARLWASKNKNGGFVMEYEVNVKELSIFHLDDEDKQSILKWIRILIENRFSYDEIEKYKVEIEWLINNIDVGDVKSSDAIIGYRADDSYFAYSRDFVANNLSIEALSNAMHLGNLGKQWVLKSKNAFSRNIIKMTGYKEIAYNDEYQKMISLNNMQYQKIKKEDNIENTFLRDIMRSW